MTNLGHHSVVKQAYNLVQALEALECHEENTEIVIKAGKLMDEIDAYVLKYGRRKPGQVKYFKSDGTQLPDEQNLPFES